MSRRIFASAALLVALAFLAPLSAPAQTRLLRQPTLSATHVAFAYAGDLWIADRAGGTARRLTSTPAVESDPHFSPDGKWIAFSSNRSGHQDVYVVSAAGGEPRRLTFYGDTFVFESVWGMFYRISPTAAFVLRAMEGGASREDLPDLLARHYAIDRTRAIRDAELFLNELTARGLVAKDAT